MRANLVNCANIGMVQGRSSPRLAAEAVQRLRVRCYIVWQELEGNEASEIKVLSFVDDAHATAAQLA